MLLDNNRRLLSLNGDRNARLSVAVSRALASLNDSRCLSTSSLNMIMFEPICSLELLLHPSNIKCDLVSYVAGFIDFKDCADYSPLVQAAVYEYTFMCYASGSIESLSLEEINALLIDSGIDVHDASCIVGSIGEWIVNQVVKSTSKSNKSCVDIKNMSIDVEVLLSCISCLMVSDTILYDGTCSATASTNLDVVISKLWRLLFNRWMNKGGAVFCYFKIASVVCTIKSALISCVALNGSEDVNCDYMRRENAFVCFSVELPQQDAASPFNQLIVGCSSSDKICDAVNKAVVCTMSTDRVMSDLASDVQSMEWVESFVWSDSPVMNTSGKIERLIRFPFNIIQCSDVPRLTSLLAMSMSNVSDCELQSILDLVDAGFGACGSQNDSSNSISIGEAVIAAGGFYSWFFSRHVRSQDRVKYFVWLHCVYCFNPERSLSKQDLISFVKFLFGICAFPHQMLLMRHACNRILRMINAFYSSRMKETTANVLSEILVSFLVCSTLMSLQEAKDLKIWMYKSICLGAGIDIGSEVNTDGVEVVMKDVFSQCYRNGAFLMPNEMDDVILSNELRDIIFYVDFSAVQSPLRTSIERQEPQDTVCGNDPSLFALIRMLFLCLSDMIYKCFLRVIGLICTTRVVFEKMHILLRLFLCVVLFYMFIFNDMSLLFRYFSAASSQWLDILVNAHS